MNSMSAAQILEILPSLSAAERNDIAKCIWEMDHSSDDLAVCLANAEEGFLMLDKMEAEDASSLSR